MKKGPFDLSLITPEYPYLAQLLANAIGQIKELPDFSDDDKITVVSDFGGEHSGASFNTYSFLFLAYNKVGPFIEKVEELRRKHGILQPYSEFRYKALKSGPRSRALPEFLELVDNFIHGAVITVAIAKDVDTVFGSSKADVRTLMGEKLSAMGFGTWDGKAAEKVLRVCHTLALFTSLMTKENQRLLWYSDDDTILANAKGRTYSDVQQMFAAALGMYSRHKFDLVGFGKQFDAKSHLDDLLSVADFSAGVVQDLLQGYKTKKDIPGGDEKIALFKWMAVQGKFLAKITVQISLLPDGEVGSGVVGFSPAADDVSH
ncbi:hypothetical protein [Hydrogenophaga sp. 2FB]|uniref:hypothetical protein n=1 Tax=Hydrogenophaga sp. 2FB TaxID=2502187 RepID=UPI0010F4D70A|nr:hypothetical protein [Hydrogenophaga sp. 2FB]